MISRHRAILPLFLIICALFCPCSLSRAQAAFKWEAVAYKGHDYVTLRSMKDFYHFKHTVKGKTITLENAKIRMIVRSGSQQCRLNGVLFILSQPIVSSRGRHLLSQTDLLNLVDPVLRPTYMRLW